MHPWFLALDLRAAFFHRKSLDLFIRRDHSQSRLRSRTMSERSRIFKILPKISSLFFNCFFFLSAAKLSGSFRSQEIKAENCDALDALLLGNTEPRIAQPRWIRFSGKMAPPSLGLSFYRLPAPNHSTFFTIHHRSARHFLPRSQWISFMSLQFFVVS